MWGRRSGRIVGRAGRTMPQTKAADLAASKRFVACGLLCLIVWIAPPIYYREFTLAVYGAICGLFGAAMFFLFVDLAEQDSARDWSERAGL